MINLLPPERQEMYRYARRNHQLLRWLAGCALGFIGLIAIAFTGSVYIQQQADVYDRQAATAEAVLKEQNQDETNRQAKEISSSIKLAVQVLGKEILFSDLLKQVAAITPADAVLSDLNISQVRGALDISANATDYAAATQLQANLADPANKIFAKADIVNITCTSNDGQSDGRYPCKVTIRALFANNNPYLFINAGKAKP